MHHSSIFAPKLKNIMKRISKVVAFSTIILTAASLTSCDTLQNTFNNLFKKQPSTPEIQKEVTLPQDREAVMVATDPKMYSPEEFTKGIIKGDWAIEMVYGQEAVGQTPPFLKFSPSDGRVYGNNGCNTVNAEYTYNPADSTLTFNNVAVTMMLCTQVGITDFLIDRALNETRSYTLEDIDDGYLMNLYDQQGKNVMQLAHQNLDFLNGTWRVAEIDGEEVDVDNMKLVFDVDEHKVHGNTGCNVLNGRLETDMDAPNTFSFESIAVTMMLCPQMEYQTAMLVALEEACRAKPIDKNRVQLLDATGEPVITLVRTTDK